MTFIYHRRRALSDLRHNNTTYLYNIILIIIASTSHATPAGRTGKREQKTRLQGHLNGQTSPTERQKVHNTG